MTGTSLPPHAATTRSPPTAVPSDDAIANDLFALHSSAYVLRYWDAPPWERKRARPSGSSRLAGRGHRRAPGRGLAVDRVLSRGRFIGWCSLNRWNPDYRSASLAYCFDDGSVGPRLCERRPRASCCGRAFDTLDLNRVPGLRPIRATWHLPACWRSSGSCR